ncbi:MAG: hypothetical protein QXO32_01790 [Candidatus Bathyarchaeia archaeon]
MCHEYAPTHFTRGIGCCGCRFKRFPTPEEEIKLLEDYKERLLSEVTDIEKRIKDLKAKGELAG